MEEETEGDAMKDQEAKKSEKQSKRHRKANAPHPLADIYAKQKTEYMDPSTDPIMIQRCEAFLTTVCKGKCYSKLSRTETRCDCLLELDDPESMRATAKFMIHFARMDITVRQILLKEWLRSAAVMKATFPRGERKKPCFVLPSVPGPNGSLKMVCKHALGHILDIGQMKWKRIEDSLGPDFLGLPGPMPKHGLTGRPGNKSMSAACKHGLQEFFIETEGQAETSTARKATGKNKVEVKVLSGVSKRNLYERYCWKNGYQVKANSQGSYPKVSDFPLRPVDVNVDEPSWPAGVEARPVCTWAAFMRYWNDNYPNLRVTKKATG